MVNVQKREDALLDYVNELKAELGRANEIIAEFERKELEAALND